MYRELKQGQHCLLFPGGGREVFKRKGEDYQLFWPETPDVVRLAAKLNATILPFSGLGGDDSFAIAADTDEILATPGLGDFFQERIAPLPSLVEGDKFVPPIGTILPERYYFAFGTPIPTSAISAGDDAAVEQAYAQLKQRVLGGIEELRALRERDGYANFARRAAFELATGDQAPPPT